MTDQLIPAWSEPFLDDARAKLIRAAALRQLDREWAWGGATGAGVKVAIIDSGIEGTHPVVQGRLVESVTVEIVDDEATVVPDEPDRPVRPRDGVRRHRRRPGARGRAVLGARARCRPARQGRGVPGRARMGRREGRPRHEPEPVVEERAALPVLPRDRRRGLLQERRARLRRQQRARPELSVDVLVASSRVAAHTIPDPEVFFYNPSPPVEWGAWGVDVPIGWNNGTHDRGDRQQLRRAAHLRPRRAHPVASIPA